MIVSFPGAGTWQFRNNSQWSQVHSLSASEMITSDLDVNGQDDILLSFAGYGLWAWSNGTTWTQLHGLVPEAVVEGELNSH